MHSINAYFFDSDNLPYAYIERTADGTERDITDELPFEIPETWEWVHISDVTTFQEGPGILAIDFRSKGIPLIRIAGMQSDVVTLDGCNYLDPVMVEKRWNHYRLDIGKRQIYGHLAIGDLSDAGTQSGIRS